MRALSIRQPYAEQILRGIKTVEYRTRPTRIIGERFYIYASKGSLTTDGTALAERGGMWSRDLSAPGAGDGRGAAPPPWMLELAEVLILARQGKLPLGLIVGSAVIERCSPPVAMDNSPLANLYQWHLTDVQRLDEPRKPQRMPQPSWFRPF